MNSLISYCIVAKQLFKVINHETHYTFVSNSASSSQKVKPTKDRFWHYTTMDDQNYSLKSSV